LRNVSEDVPAKECWISMSDIMKGWLQSHLETTPPSKLLSAHFDLWYSQWGGQIWFQYSMMV
jgi:hypothetical protein